MNTKLLSFSAWTASLLCCNVAHAAYVGLQSQLHTNVTIAGSLYDVYRVYANFNNPNDQLLVVSGSQSAGPLTISQLNASASGPGSGFYNNAFGGPLAPNPALFPFFPELQWDTFVTIGMPTGPQPEPDATTLSPGFDTAVITGTGATTFNSAWFVTPDAPQSFAGPDLRVMIAQFTVNSGEIACGIVNINGVSGGGPFTANGQSILCIPSPAAQALLGITGFMKPRRRRG